MVADAHLGLLERGECNRFISLYMSRELIVPLVVLVFNEVGEVGELSEIFQWKGEVAKGLPDWKEEEKVHLGEELSDVLLYLVQLSDVCGINLGEAALRKVQLNAVKYPVAPSKERSSTGEEDVIEPDGHGSAEEVDEIV